MFQATYSLWNKYLAVELMAQMISTLTFFMDIPKLLFKSSSNLALASVAQGRALSLIPKSQRFDAWSRERTWGGV